MKKWLREYFTFSKGERNGIVVLLLILLVIIFLPDIKSLFESKKPIDFSAFKNEIAEFEKQTKPVAIGDSASSVTKNKISQEKPHEYSKPAKEKIDLNTADSLTLVSLYGIGPVLSARIIKFRNKLGGFYSVEQLSDVYGLKPETYEALKDRLIVSPLTSSPLSVNTSSAKELKQNPYITYTVANAIVKYRTEHGNYKTLEEVKNCGALDDKLYRKIGPYLSL